MLPLIARVHVINRSGRGVRLWVPLFLVWLLLLPFAIVVLPILFVIWVVADVDPWPALKTIWNFLSSFSGTNVEVDAPDASVFVHVV